VTSTEDTSFFVPSSTNSEDGGLLEELCETLILTIVMVLWKGVVGSDDEAWMVCCFSSHSFFDNLHSDSWSNLLRTSLSSS
jgi:hypothetical protein